MNIHHAKQPSKHPKIESYRISMRKLPNFSKKVTEFLKENKSRASQAMYIYNIRTIQICKTIHNATTETRHKVIWG